MGNMFADNNIANWIFNEGSEDNIVLYSKVSIYRNLENIRFHHHMDKSDFDKVDSILQKNIEDLNLNLTKIKLADIKPYDIKILKENLTLPKKRNLLNATLYTNSEQSTSILINSNEHLEIQTIARGLELNERFKTAYNIENKLDEKTDFAFDKKFGYLTSSPKKIGTAMNLTVAISVPAILWKTPDNIDYFINKFSKLGFDLSILPIGKKNIPILTVTNKVMIGIKEKDILKNTLDIVHDILDKEKNIRKRIKKLYKIKVEDRIYRSKAILSSARVLNYGELIKYSFWLRIGLYYGILKDIKLDDLYYMLFASKNNHLQIQNINSNKEKNINEIRANMVRDILNDK